MTVKQGHIRGLDNLRGLKIQFFFMLQVIMQQAINVCSSITQHILVVIAITIITNDQILEFLFPK